MDRMKGILMFAAVLLMAACSPSEEGGGPRIVSLMPSNTEIISELGFEDELVGVTTEDDYPESVADDEELLRMDTFELDEEQLIGLEPTHIVAHESSDGMHREMLDRVAETTGAEVLTVEEARDIDEIYESIRQIGAFFSAEEDAEDVISGIARELGDLKGQYSDEDTRSAFIHISDQPEIYTAGSGTFIDDALAWIDVGNAFDDMEGYPAVSAEDIVERDPDILVSVMGLSDEALSQSVSDTPGLQDMAVSDPENQCNINPDLLTRPGPRIAEGLGQTAECVYE
ncbi:MAG TPA: ABC transporter substrate-binding protein [Candidatus Salinicoccus stercoripullorum]|uniref:ABC transporter substrate-binding protein n=1 Tax=Candidatus Salinicoccus stercoripullorum TaxID=2838756 RepID=A0A9D1QHL9_9STAP|nr:ABC transporter substrate-binding protein [Candidatus Salinicoccus stercoripullorum]